MRSVARGSLSLLAHDPTYAQTGSAINRAFTGGARRKDVVDGTTPRRERVMLYVACRAGGVKGWSRTKGSQWHAGQLARLQPAGIDDPR